ncbi:MAG: hypothetical protein AAGA90_16900 [Actinomycetota bacterium]
MRTAKRPLVILTLLVSVMVLAGACGSSNDPETWGEAQEDGRLRENFMAACVEANGEDGAAVEFTDAQITNYCECAFVEIVEYFGGSINADNELVDVADAVAGRDFEAFRSLESDLRDDPTQIPADIEAFLNGCAQNA